jgi:hypothetical protein
MGHQERGHLRQPPGVNRRKVIPWELTIHHKTVLIGCGPNKDVTISPFEKVRMTTIVYAVFEFRALINLIQYFTPCSVKFQSIILFWDRWQCVLVY